MVPLRSAAPLPIQLAAGSRPPWSLARSAAGLGFHRRFGVILQEAISADFEDLELPPSAAELSKALKSAATRDPWLVVPWRAPQVEDVTSKTTKKRMFVSKTVNWEKTPGYGRSKPVADWITGYLGPPDPNPDLHGWVFDMLSALAFLRLIDDAGRRGFVHGDRARAALRTQLDGDTRTAADLELDICHMDQRLPIREALAEQLPYLWLGMLARGVGVAPNARDIRGRARPPRDDLVTTTAGGHAWPAIGQILVGAWARLLLHADGNEGIERDMAGRNWFAKGKNLYVQWLDLMIAQVDQAASGGPLLENIGRREMKRAELILTPERLGRWAMKVAPLDLADLLIHLQARIVPTVSSNVKSVRIEFPADVTRLIRAGRSL
jgi:hypothetical protein